MIKKIITGISIFMVVFSAACHRPKISKKTGENLSSRPDSVGAVKDSLHKQVASSEQNEDLDIEELDFTYLTAKSKVSFKNRSQNYDNANVNLRIRKDSLIWFSITGLGLEVARGIISKDSIVLIDKFHKQHYVYNYDQISKQFNFKLNYALIQSVIVGNLPIPRDPDEKIRKEKDYLLLHQNQGRVLVDSYIGKNNRKLKKLQAVEQPSKNSLTLDYEDFKELNAYLFPYTSLITLDVKREKDKDFYQTVIKMKHSKVDIKETSPGFPFSVPSGYTRKQIP